MSPPSNILIFIPSVNEAAFCTKRRLERHAGAGYFNSNSNRFGINKFSDNQKRMWSGYLATVTYMDEQVGRILDALKKLKLDKETTVIFTSDHGYLLGEHHFWQKGNLREEVTRVPLIIRSPKVLLESTPPSWN